MGVSAVVGSGRLGLVGGEGYISGGVGIIGGAIKGGGNGTRRDDKTVIREGRTK